MERADIGAEGLKIAIGFPSAVMLVVGGIVGVGIFANPAIVAQDLHSPFLALAAWGAGGVVALLGAFVYAELAARFPATGGEYVYLRDTYGPLVGFLFGWTTLLVVHTGGLAAVTIVFAQNLDVLVGGGLSERLVVVVTLAVLAAVNCLGVTMGNGAQSLLGLAKIAVIGVLIAAGLLLAPHAGASGAVPPRGSTGLLKAFGGAMIPVVFSYGGWQTANYVAGEIKNPGRNLARALMAGVALVILIYLLVNIACLRALGVDALGKTLTPTSDVLARSVGPAAGRLAAAAIALSALAFMSQSMLTGPRVCFAMARDGLFFRSVARVSPGSRAPAVATLVVAAWTGVLALSGRYDQILSYVVSMNFLFFGLSASCLFTLRWRDRRAAALTRPAFEAPWHPWTTGAFILASAAIVAFSFWAYPVNSLVGYAILLLGVPPYLYWRRQGSPPAVAALSEPRP
jgi:APA family basic amino acid/polyamine antiporter